MSFLAVVLWTVAIFGVIALALRLGARERFVEERERKAFTNFDKSLVDMAAENAEQRRALEGVQAELRVARAELARLHDCNALLAADRDEAWAGRASALEERDKALREVDYRIQRMPLLGGLSDFLGRWREWTANGRPRGLGLGGDSFGRLIDEADALGVSLDVADGRAKPWG